MKKKVVVIGGGAAGMVAAISAARMGAKVLILEHKEKLGKKILATGNGRCNYTNLYQSIECYRSENIPFVKEVFSHFNEKDTVNFFKDLGIYPKSKNGYLYPYNEQAASVVEVLKMEIENLGIEVIYNCNVKKIGKDKSTFTIQSDIGVVEQKKQSAKKKEKLVIVNTYEKVFQADRVIVATGGMAAEKLGSDGSGYSLLKQLGHKVIPVVPALVQLKAKGDFFEQIAGVRMDARVSVYVDNIFMGADTGELQLTSYGISGIPVFQVSRFAAVGLNEKKQVKVVLDLFPELGKDELIDLLMERKRVTPYKNLNEILIGLLNPKIVIMLLQTKQMMNVSKQDYSIEVNQLVSLVKEFSLDIIDTNGFDNAQVCAGGIDTNEIFSDTLESKIISGLYVVGELLDVDGICGGYNLQWAWTSGVVAGNAIMAK